MFCVIIKISIREIYKHYYRAHKAQTTKEKEMKDYQLKEDEVVLFKGDIELQGVKGKTELIFTNHNFVFITKHKKVFAKEETYVQIYPVSDVKIYEKKPQIKIKDLMTEIYFLSGEKVFKFFSEVEQTEFVAEVQKLFEKKSAVSKGLEKAKNALKNVGNMIGEKNIEKAKTVAKTVAVVAGKTAVKIVKNKLGM